MTWWPGRAASLSRWVIRSWLAAAPSTVTISLRRCWGGSAATAWSRILMWSSASCRPFAQHPGERLAGVVAVAQQRVIAEPLEIRLGAFFVRMARHDRRLHPQAPHPRQDPVPDPRAPQTALPRPDR